MLAHQHYSNIVQEWRSKTRIPISICSASGRIKNLYTTSFSQNFIIILLGHTVPCYAGGARKTTLNVSFWQHFFMFGSRPVGWWRWYLFFQPYCPCCLAFPRARLLLLLLLLLSLPPPHPHSSPCGSQVRTYPMYCCCYYYTTPSRCTRQEH